MRNREFVFAPKIQYQGDDPTSSSRSIFASAFLFPKFLWYNDFDKHQGYAPQL